MRTRLHRFLLILLMLGLPVQAYAATAMLVCASGHPVALPMTAADASMAECHEPEPVPLQAHECKHCAVCALASALPIPVADTLRWTSAVPHFQPPAAVTFSGYIPDSPERPPRTILA